MLEKFYPSIATLIKSEDFPQSLRFLHSIADNILQDFFYKDYFASKNATDINKKRLSQNR